MLNLFSLLGGLPKNLAVFENASDTLQQKISVFRNIYDFEEVFEAVQEAKSIAIVGGGFLGSELACALARVGT